MDTSITLICPSCGGKTRLDAGTQRIQCDYCGVEQIIRPSGPVTAVPVVVEKPPVPLPERIKLEKRGQSLVMKWRWFSIKFLPLAFFCLVWDGFLLFWYGIVFSTGAPLIAALFPLVHLAVGAGLTYYVLAGFLNTTTVLINRKEFVVHHTPLPWPGELTLPVTDLAQLYTKRKISRGKNSTTITYELWVELRSGRKRKLISGLEDPDLGQYLEQQVESFLQINDRPMPEEYGRGLDYTAGSPVNFKVVIPVPGMEKGIEISGSGIPQDLDD